MTYNLLTLQPSNPVTLQYHVANSPEKFILFCYAFRIDCAGRDFFKHRDGLVTDQKPEKSLIGHLLDASSVGIQLVVSTFAGLLIGYGLDRLFHTFPWLTFIFLIIGIISGFRELLKIARKTDRRDNDENSKGSV